MRRIKSSLLLAVALIAGFSINSLDAITVGATCTNNGGIAPNPLDKTQFYFCLGGKVHMGTCTDGRIFDANSATCVYPGEGGATGGTNGVCPDNTTILLPDPYGNCQNYVVYTNGVPALKTCMCGSYFNPETKTCGSTIPANCNAYMPTCLCNNTPDGLFPNYSNCQTYYMCLNGNMYQMTCPPGYYFDFSKQACFTSVPTGCTQIL